MQDPRADLETILLKAARPREEQLEQLFTLSLDLLCVAGADGYFKLLNPSWEKTLGYSLAELLEHPYLDFIHPQDREPSTNAANQLLAGSQLISFENRFRCKDGSYRWLLWNAAPGPDKTSIYALGRDITERKRAERRLAAGYSVTTVLAEAPSLAAAAPRILRAICESLEWDSGAIWQVDEASQSLRCVDIWHVPHLEIPQFESMTRTAPFRAGVGLPGRVWANRQAHWIPDVVVDSNFPRSHAALREGLHAAFGFPIRFGEDILGVFEFFSREIRQPDAAILQLFEAMGSQIGQFIVRRRAEEELKEYASYLEAARQAQEENANRLSLLVKELDAARKRAEEATGAKGEFLASVSHDIRTPMNAIIGMTELALQEDLPPRQRHYMQTARDSANGVVSLVNDILEFSKGEARRIELDRVEFRPRPLIEDMMRSLEIRARQKGIRLRSLIAPQVPELLVGDPERLRRIIVNLAGNAIKFTERGEVTLRGEVEQQPESEGMVQLHFAVSDTGIGIPAEKQQAIFQAFTQAEASTSRLYGGSGLGLAICSQLVELMGGKIWVESEVGRGSTFHFTARFGLPHSSEEAGAGDSASQHPRAFPAARKITRAEKPLRILVVDDVPVNRELAEDFLRRRGHTVAAAGSGREAHELLRRQRFDAVLMDLEMPDMDGREATRLIRQSERKTGVHLPIIAMTGHASAADADASLAAGMDGWITKPIDFARLFTVVESAAKNGTAKPVTHEPIPARKIALSSETLLRSAGGNSELLARLIRVFLADSPKRMSAIRTALAKGNTASLAQAAHAFKGALGNFGASRVVEEAKSLEECARAGKLDEARKLFKGFEKNVVHFEQALRHLGLAPKARRKRKKNVPRKIRRRKS
ncbi:MAG TPA: ATP-binding protein [Candidatus Acidoferrales bacterium]|nr:ATP-binding protein [Candidatus Acidoferrales bacterium]